MSKILILFMSSSFENKEYLRNAFKMVSLRVHQWKSYLISIFWRCYENEHHKMKNNYIYNVRKARVEIPNEYKTGYLFCYTWVLATVRLVEQYNNLMPDDLWVEWNVENLRDVSSMMYLCKMINYWKEVVGEFMKESCRFTTWKFVEALSWWMFTTYIISLSISVINNLAFSFDYKTRGK